MRSVSNLTPSQAVVRGHIVVTVPVLLIIGLAGAVAYLRFRSLLSLEAGALVGSALGWLWWSATVPRWREWAKRMGADEERTQKLAQRTGLIWPKGWIFENTEFRHRKRP